MSNFALTIPTHELFSSFSKSMTETRGSQFRNDILKCCRKYFEHLLSVGCGRTFPVPYSEYWITDKSEKVVGHVQIRHKPSASTAMGDEMKSHVYFESIPSENRKEIYEEIFPSILIEATNLGIQELLVSCHATDAWMHQTLKGAGAKLVGSKYVSTSKRSAKLFAISIGE